MTDDAVDSGTKPERSDTAASAHGAGGAGESAPAAAEGFGAALRRARQAAGMSVGELAGRLHLHPKQIDALEREDFSALPTLIYVRGFVRSCARELKLDPTPLLAALEGKAEPGKEEGPPKVSPGAGRVVIPPEPAAARSGTGLRFGIAAVIAVFAAAIAVVAFVRAPHGKRAHEAVTSPATGATSRAAAVPSSPAPAAVPEPSASPAVSRPAPAASAETPAGGGAPAAATGASVSIPAPAGEKDRSPVPAVHPEAAAGGTAPEKAVAAGAGPGGQANAVPVPAGEAGELVLRAKEDVWIDVSDSAGRTLLSRIVPAGSVQAIAGAPPLHLIVGKASAVTAQFRGHAVDLQAHASENDVARLVLE